MEEILRECEKNGYSNNEEMKEDAVYIYLRDKFDNYKKDIYEFFIKSTRQIKEEQTNMCDLHDLYEIWAIKNKKQRIPWNIFVTLFSELIVPNDNYRCSAHNGFNKKISKNWALWKGDLINLKKHDNSMNQLKSL